MKTLEDIKNQFEDKTIGGYEVNILAYHPDQNQPIYAEVRKGNRWELLSLSKDGHYKDDSVSNFNLVKKRSVLPKDILCEVWEDGGGKRKRFSDGEGKFYRAGASSLTNEDCTMEWQNYRVIENEPKPWFGGECPIPEGCKHRIRINGRWVSGMAIPEQDGWGHENFITAYQILGEIDE